ncbi:MAG: PKD domain-containing protein [Actinobacteria bacterium]|nr:MAG: PKD domain-containing protein [Actinomycetota bacterium]
MNERRSHGRGALATAVACTLVALGPAAGAARAAPFQPLLAPTVAFDFSPAHPRVGDNVTFTSTSTDVGATITSEDWDFNHDGATDASGHVAHHTFNAAGSFIVTLTVTNDATPTPESNSAPRTVTVAANQPPVASFTFTPGAPLVGATVTFKSTSTDSDGTIVSQAWDLDNDGQFNDGTGLTATTAFTTPGPHVVRLEVTDDLGATNISSINVNVNQPPTASYTYKPDKPVEGDTVTFTSAATDPDGTIARTQWDLDGDGAFNDATGATATKTFSAPGTFDVGLRVTDDRGAVATTKGTISVIANNRPTAAFTYAPGTLNAGDTVTFTSSAKDSDGSIAAQDWDLNGDGVFDDAHGATAKRTFDAGAHRVSLKVTDDRGATDIAFQTITVSGSGTDSTQSSASPNTFISPGPTGAPAPHNGPSVMSPFPIVSLRGRLVRGGAIITALQVLQMPRNARVEVRCSGRGCPFRRSVRSAGTRHRTLRFRAAERRLRAGVVISVLITRPGQIGKYTSFKIRRSGTPLRKDRCLLPGARLPTRCST